ncbi:MAG: hypothetical protein JNL58_24290 [Planctomyces sp.]|nr:hypothetical protein [Planctomyces sp.]
MSPPVMGYSVGGLDITAERDEYFGPGLDITTERDEYFETKDGDGGNSVIGFIQYPLIVFAF